MKSKMLLLFIVCTTLSSLNAQLSNKTYKLYMVLPTTPIKISDSIKALGTLKITVKGIAKLVKTGINYELAPDTTAKYGDTVLVTIQANKKGIFKVIEKRKYVVSIVNKPYPRIGYLPSPYDPNADSSIKHIYTIKEILNADSLRVEFFDDELPCKNDFKIIGYNFTYLSTKIIVGSNKSIKGNNFKSIKLILTQLQSGDLVLLENIRVKSKYGIVPLNSLTITIK